MIWKWPGILFFNSISLLIASASAAQRQVAADGNGDGDANFEYYDAHDSVSDNNNDGDDDAMQQLLRARLQNHVEAQLKKVLSADSQQHCANSGGNHQEQCEPPPPVDVNWRIIEADQVPNYFDNIISNIHHRNNFKSSRNSNNNLLELELDIDSLPSDLADFVMNHEQLLFQNDYDGGDDIIDEEEDVRIRRDGANHKESNRYEDLEEVEDEGGGDDIQMHHIHDVKTDGIINDDPVNAQNTFTTIVENKRKQSPATSPDVTRTPCPLGTYSVALPSATTVATTTTLSSEGEGGEDPEYYDLDYKDYITTNNDDKHCLPCPEGTTTLRVGSSACQVVTVEDLLGMLYDLASGKSEGRFLCFLSIRHSTAHVYILLIMLSYYLSFFCRRPPPLNAQINTGDSWSEQQRGGWKSELPVCDWEGVSCDVNGEINGLLFPAIGFPIITSDSDGM